MLSRIQSSNIQIKSPTFFKHKNYNQLFSYNGVKQFSGSCEELRDNLSNKTQINRIISYLYYQYRNIVLVTFGACYFWIEKIINQFALELSIINFIKIRETVIAIQNNLYRHQLIIQKKEHMFTKKTSLEMKQKQQDNEGVCELDWLQLQSRTEDNQLQCLNRLKQMEEALNNNQETNAQVSSDGCIEFGDLVLESRIIPNKNNRLSCAIGSDLSESVMMINQMKQLKITQKCVAAQQNLPPQVHANENSAKKRQTPLKQWDEEQSMMIGNSAEDNKIRLSGAMFNHTFQENFDNFDLQSHCIEKGGKQNGLRGILLKPINGASIVAQRNNSKSPRPSTATANSMMRSVI